MTVDIERVRTDTPGTANVLHFNNAGAALMPQPVIDSQIAHIRREGEIGGYEAKAEAGERIDAVYGSIARLIGARGEEIALVENATVAWDMAFYAQEFGPGDRILTAQAEYAANVIAFLQVARKTGATIEVIPNTDEGATSADALRGMMDERVKLISITHVPTNGGLVNPVEEIGKVAREHGVTYLVDACQSVGQLPVDVGAIGCDLLSATGRKYLRGPRGSGFLFVRSALLAHIEPPMIDMHAAEWVAADRYELRKDARRFENWESNYAAQLGLGAAVDYALAVGLPAIWERVRVLAARLREALGDNAAVTVHDVGRVQCGIVSFSLAGRDAQEIAAALRTRAMNVAVSSRSSTLFDAEARGLPELLRASVHYYNTEDEVDRFAAAVAELSARR